MPGVAVSPAEVEVEGEPSDVLLAVVGGDLGLAESVVALGWRGGNLTISDIVSALVSLDQ